MAPPFKVAEFDIMYGRGISKSGDILDCAVEHGFLSKAGSWYSFDGERIGQGRENVKTYLEEHPEIMDRLEGMILDSIRPVDYTVPDDILNVDEDGVIIE